MWAEFITAILRAVLPWLFSGETTSRVEHLPGLPALNIKRSRAVSLRDLPALCAALALLLALNGCAFGGAKETQTVIFVEPGQVVEIATDSKIPVSADGRTVTQKNIGGCVAMPKSVYRAMREAWLQVHPEARGDDPARKTTPVLHGLPEHNGTGAD